MYDRKTPEFIDRAAQCSGRVCTQEPARSAEGGEGLRTCDRIVVQQPDPVVAIDKGVLGIASNQRIPGTWRV